METDDGCIGREGIGGCRFPPEFVVGGDLACHYHLVSVTRRRLSELGRPIKIEATEPKGT